MKRREMILLAVLAGVAPCAGLAQEAQRPARIGYLAASQSPQEAIFRAELRRLGRVEGENLVIERRYANGDFSRLPALAKELVDLNVDLVVAQVTQASVAAKNATTKIPIVMIAVSDPVAAGIITSLGRPGGNVTGTSAGVGGVAGKQLELLRELMPGIARVAVLWNPANSTFQQQQLKEAKDAAAPMQLQLQLVEARSESEIEPAFRAIADGKLPALLVLADPVYVTHARRIADLALKYRLPSVSGSNILAEQGILMTYGPSFHDAYLRAAVYVDRILKGARPADLPVERSSRYELILNAGTARVLGLNLPRELVLRADRVID